MPKTQDYVAHDCLGNVIGYVVNAPSKEAAQRMAHKHDDFFSIEETAALNVPDMFSNCWTDNPDMLKQLAIIT